MSGVRRFLADVKSCKTSRYLSRRASLTIIHRPVNEACEPATPCCKRLLQRGREVRYIGDMRPPCAAGALRCWRMTALCLRGRRNRPPAAYIWRGPWAGQGRQQHPISCNTGGFFCALRRWFTSRRHIPVPTPVWASSGSTLPPPAPPVLRGIVLPRIVPFLHAFADKRHRFQGACQFRRADDGASMTSFRARHERRRRR